MDFELSALNLAAMDKALAAEGLREAVYALISPEARAGFREPHSARWHPGRYGIELWNALLELGGKPRVEEFNYQMTKKSFGPIVGPLAKLGMTLSGSTPASIFARLESLVSVALRGVIFEWKLSSPNGGVQTITYPCPIPSDALDAAWRGVFRVGSEIAGRTIRVDRFEAPTDRSCRFELSW